MNWLKKLLGLHPHRRVMDEPIARTREELLALVRKDMLNAAYGRRSTDVSATDVVMATREARRKAELAVQ